ncbi:unnamed protein product [Prorocentrum cordatum]|uniref:Uncharacterized protein n=1 Tax=Prorocentrum cordatum TaxID=2364126 RepID=A0ABN9XBP1_9DINO|nr:unnamed protein product [Polarella glacialis]
MGQKHIRQPAVVTRSVFETLPRSQCFFCPAAIFELMSLWGPEAVVGTPPPLHLRPRRSVHVSVAVSPALLGHGSLRQSPLFPLAATASVPFFVASASCRRLAPCRRVACAFCPLGA